MSPLAPGAVVGGLYEVVRPIGKGGMAWVYAARPLDGGDEVAVKVLTVRAEADDDLKHRFLQELLLVGRVRHRNIVALHDFGVTEQGAPYLVMELLRGTTLASELKRRGALPDEQVGRLFTGALEALALAHARGVVHQDLKPSNLFLRSNVDGTEDLVLLDFGIARRVDQAPSRQREWTATPRYAAPEYILRGEVRPSVDVYQVGLVIAEALSGRPVVASTVPSECLAAHTSGRLELGPAAAASRLHAVIRRALAPDPAERFADAGEMLVALKGALARPDLVAVLGRRLADDEEELSQASEVPHHHPLVAPALADEPRVGRIVAGVLAFAVVGVAVFFAVGLWVHGF